MNKERQPPYSRDEFSALLAEVELVIDVTRHLPYLPFRASCGQVDVCEYMRLISGPFAEILGTLADTHGDESIALVTLEPDPFAYCEQRFPGFRMARSDLPNGYWAQLNYQLAGDSSGPIWAVSDVVALTGSTRTWSVYGHRNWDVALVHSPASRRPWLESEEVPFVSPREALEWFTEKFVPLKDAERSIFLSNMDAMAARSCG